MQPNHANARPYYTTTRRRVRLARTPAIQGDIGCRVFFFLDGVTDRAAEGVDGSGDEPIVGVARVPFWALAPVNPNQTTVPATKTTYM